MLRKLNERTPITVIVEGDVYKKFQTKIGDKSASKAIREFMNSVVEDPTQNPWDVME